jgi:glycosyltransferase involved in cell wall biosynthesis
MREQPQRRRREIIEMQQPGPDISAIVPVGERRDDVPRLLDEYAQGLSQAGVSFEIIVVLDGHCGGLGAELAPLALSRDWFRVIELARSFGESAALTAGFDEAQGHRILTLPAYYQVVPSELGKLISAAEETDMAIAVRWPRAGSGLEGWRRNAFHRLLGFITGQKYRDLGCGVRLLRREIADEIPLYGERHRFYPTLARSRGFRVREVEVAQSPQDDFRGRYRLREYLHRILDILTLFFLVRFTKKPLRFFGTIGFLVASIGVIFLAILLVQRIFFAVGLADRPALLLSSLMLVLGVQIFALGLIGELVIFTHAAQLKEYAVRAVISAEEGERDAETRQADLVGGQQHADAGEAEARRRSG